LAPVTSSLVITAVFTALAAAVAAAAAEVAAATLADISSFPAVAAELAA
jgi:hypothetical protein